MSANPRQTEPVDSVEQLACESDGWLIYLTFDQENRVIGLRIEAAYDMVMIDDDGSEVPLEDHERYLQLVERGRLESKVYRSDPGQITSTLLRSIPLARLAESARAQALATMRTRAALGARDRITADEWRRRFRGRPGRAGRDPVSYALVAHDYVYACQVSARPVAWLAEQYGVTTATIRNKVHEARRRGLLTAAASPRQAGGELTELANTLLESMIFGATANGGKSPIVANLSYAVAIEHALYVETEPERLKRRTRQ